MFKAGDTRMQILKERKIKNLKQVRIQELSLFDFIKLATATNNFDLANKLGQGGFGPVYKVIFFYQSSSSSN